MSEKKIAFEKSGIVLLNKSAGISSNSAVNRVKKLLGAKKCGHLGTLDLEAEGLLLVTVNSATKLFDFFLQKDKTYETIFDFGYETDTLDLSGEVMKEKSCKVQKKALEKACQTMLGKQEQMPPQFSAKKVGGKVAYHEARAGRTLELVSKEIEIFEMKVLEEIQENRFKLQISCSSGTYIRAIARDLAKKLGTFGTMRSLLRTKCAGFELENATTLEEIEQGKICFVESEKLFDFKKVDLSALQKEKLLNGQEIESEEAGGVFSLYCQKQFLGLGKVENGRLKISLRLM